MEVSRRDVSPKQQYPPEKRKLQRTSSSSWASLEHGLGFGGRDAKSEIWFSWNSRFELATSPRGSQPRETKHEKNEIRSPANQRHNPICHPASTWEVERLEVERLRCRTVIIGAWLPN
jgi:hypothetical protein